MNQTTIVNRRPIVLIDRARLNEPIFYNHPNIEFLELFKHGMDRTGRKFIEVKDQKGVRRKLQPNEVSLSWLGRVPGVLARQSLQMNKSFISRVLRKAQLPIANPTTVAWEKKEIYPSTAGIKKSKKEFARKLGFLKADAMAYFRDILIGSDVYLKPERGGGGNSVARIKLKGPVLVISTNDDALRRVLKRKLRAEEKENGTLHFRLLNDKKIREESPFWLENSSYLRNLKRFFDAYTRHVKRTAPGRTFMELAVPVARLNDRPVEIRLVIVNASNQFKYTGSYAKIGRANSPTANISQGAEAADTQKTLEKMHASAYPYLRSTEVKERSKKLFGLMKKLAEKSAKVVQRRIFIPDFKETNPEYIEEVIRLANMSGNPTTRYSDALRTVKHMHKRTAYGVDISLVHDQKTGEFKPMIMEVNGQPGLTGLKEVDPAAYQQIRRYEILQIEKEVSKVRHTNSTKSATP